MFKLFKFLYSPDDVPGSGPSSDDKESVIEFLKDDEPEDGPIELGKDKSLPKDTKKDKTKDKDEVDETDETDDDNDEDEVEDDDDELEALVDDKEQPDEEQLELTTPVRRKEILKKYPNLFKDFPYLEKAYYREQQFTEILPTIQDAKEAVKKSQVLDRFEGDLLKGNTETILKAVKDNDVNSFYKIVDEYLPTLARVDEKAYYHVMGNIMKQTVVSMLQAAKSSNNEALQSAAQILHQYAFGNSDFVAPTKLAKDTPQGKDPAIAELEGKQREFTKQQFESARGDLNTRVNNSIKSTIEANIDPRSSMPEYVKKNAVRDANEQLEHLIGQDKRFKEIIDRLWDNVFKNNFSRESVDKIRSAYLSKSKTLLPSVIKKARNEALKGIGKRVKEDDDESPSNKRPAQSKEPRQETKTKKSGDIPRGMRSIDFLMQD